MKLLLGLLLFHFSLLATQLQEVKNSLSTHTLEQLKKEFLSSPSSLYASNAYNLKKGWNELTAPKDGIDVVETFKDISQIKYVLTYDVKSKFWAGMSNEESPSNMLFLKYLEPGVTFFVLAKKDVKVKVQSNLLDAICQKFYDDKSFNAITDSGTEQAYVDSLDDKISLQSRYFSHHMKGIYDDTRVTLFYKKEKNALQNSLKYGPASPKVAIKYSKAYEGKQFYLYDYKQEKCFMGIFPSRKIPPFPTLKELKQ